jgi:hypothetical protein
VSAKAPLCLNCGKPLRRYKYRGDYPGQEWGDYGDGHFCGQTCGYRWAVMYLSREPAYAVRLHESMLRVMAKRDGSKSSPGG